MHYKESTKLLMILENTDPTQGLIIFIYTISSVYGLGSKKTGFIGPSTLGNPITVHAAYVNGAGDYYAYI